MQRYDQIVMVIDMSNWKKEEYSIEAFLQISE